jgi:hypothetical protein
VLVEGEVELGGDVRTDAVRVWRWFSRRVRG